MDTRPPPVADRGMSELLVRRVRPEEALTFRELRLRALADAPYAFASSLAAEQDKPDELWRSEVRRYASGGDSAVFLVESAEVGPFGLTGCFLRDRRPEIAHVVSVWVDPAMRRRGAARLLMEAAEAWARQVGARTIELWVARDNLAARALYEDLGFTETGQAQPLPSQPSRLESLLQRPL